MPADSLQAWVLNLPQAKFYLFLISTSVASVAGFIYAFIFFRRARIIEDTPTSKIRSAAQGYVELAGRGELMEGESIIAPLTTTPCTWYRYKVEKVSDKHSRVVASGVSDELFVLVGTTGRCVVDPDDATVTCKTKKVWYERSYPSSRGSHNSGGFFGALGGRYRYTEERMHPGEPLYAIGMFMSVGGGAESFNTEAEVREVLSLWKKNRTGMLKHFDADGDGDLDMQEWEAVRKAAYGRVRREQSKRSVQPPTHIMKKPQYDNRPYLLSVFPQRELVKRYKLRAGASLAGFFVAGVAAVFMATVRLIQ
jgi:E3 ubiquitin ligase